VHRRTDSSGRFGAARHGERAPHPTASAHDTAASVQNYVSTPRAGRGARLLSVSGSDLSEGVVAGVKGCAAVSAIAWIWVGAALWVAVTLPVALLIGAVIRGRDHQVPQLHPAGQDTSPDPVIGPS
jgi:hypothetical protein